MSRVFVAGATGVLGRRVVSALIAAGHTVTANVRNDDARKAVEAVGASPTTIDLFDTDDTRSLGESHDVIVNVATSIPTGVRAARPAAWAMNDRLRTEASANLAAAMASTGSRYIGESITFPYVDSGDIWIDESFECSYFIGNESCRVAEDAAQGVTEAGGTGIALRFAMFFANDSGHVEMLRSMARRGLFGAIGQPDSFISWIHADDAAAAVVAAMVAPPGIYNVAEVDPVRRRDHAVAIASSAGRKKVRSVPKRLLRLGGDAADSMSRSQRVSSESFRSATGWEPKVNVVDCW